MNHGAILARCRGLGATMSSTGSSMNASASVAAAGSVTIVLPVPP
jgi:hypothetical protein